MSYEKNRPRDPHTDPLRAPSVLGQHPHLVRTHEDRTGDPSFMYETRDAVTGVYRPHPPLPVKAPLGDAGAQSSDSSFWLGLGLLGVAAVSALLLANSKRQNPTVHAPSPATVIVTPAAGAQAPATTPTVIEAAAPSAPPRRKRRAHARRTTQARDDKGHFLPAGTRRKAIVEGKR